MFVQHKLNLLSSTHHISIFVFDLFVGLHEFIDIVLELPNTCLVVEEFLMVDCSLGGAPVAYGDEAVGFVGGKSAPLTFVIAVLH